MTAGPTVTDQPAVATGTAVTAMTAGDRCVGAIATFAAVAAADRPVVAGRQTIGPRASTGAARRPPGSASPTQARVATVTARPRRAPAPANCHRCRRHRRHQALHPVNRPGMSGDSSSWKGWGHVRWFIEEVPAGAA